MMSNVKKIRAGGLSLRLVFFILRGLIKKY